MTETHASGLEVRCNGCKQTFRADVTVRPDGEGGEVHEMHCPHCRAIYTAARVTAWGVGLREQLTVVTDPAERTRLVAELRKEITR